MSRTLLALAVGCALAGASRVAAAQSPRPADDPPSRPVAAWVSGSIGTGDFSSPLENSLAVVSRGNVSVGRFLVTYRHTRTDRWESRYGLRDDAVLAGVRTDNPRVFGTVALGFAAARPYETGSGGELTSKANGLAYDVALHGNVLILGGALSFSGVAFAHRASYLMVNLGLEAGWFGP